MPNAHINGVSIHYDVGGQTGPWVVIIPGGRNTLSAHTILPNILVSRGYRVVVHDRRNCGLSSVKLDATASEDESWTDDLQALLELIGARPALLLGVSGGARVAVKLVQRNPAATSGLALWGMSGGQIAARYLENNYYSQYIRAAESGGMQAVCALDHFANLVANRPENRDQLMAINTGDFCSTLRAWRREFMKGAGLPIIGIRDDELLRLSAPTVIVPIYDRLHPMKAAGHAHRMIANSHLADFDPARRVNSSMTQADWLHDEAVVAGIVCAFEASLSRRSVS